jgi:hypothetical protein
MGILWDDWGDITGKPSLVDKTGNSYFVNEATGLDTNPGNIGYPFATLDAGLAAASALNGDTVYLQGSSHRTTTLAWNKNGVNLVGINSPSNNGRARISVLPAIGQTAVTALTRLVDVTAQGCYFANVGAFHGFNGSLTPPTASVAWLEEGGRNYYRNVNFLGGGDVLTSALAGMRSLKVGGAGENIFDRCTIGLDTETRATAVNASLEFFGGTPRNIFRESIFPMLSSLTTNLFVLIGAGGIDRYVLFDHCNFINEVDSGGATLAVAATVNASAGGSVLFKDCSAFGVTALATSGPVFVDGNVTAGAATTASIGIRAT